jgi:putative heme-binding domain-containing protein
VQGTFEIAGAHIVSPGDPYRSVLFYRLSKLGRGRMPHIGSEIIDEDGTRLIHDWIRQIPPRKEERTLLEKLRTLEDASVSTPMQADRAAEIKAAAEAIARAAGRKTVIPEDTQKAAVQLRIKAAAEAKVRAEERAAALGKLLSSTSSSLLLAQAVAERRLPEPICREVIAAAMVRPEPQIRDLFERFVPEDQRVKRLGNVIKPEQILSLKGDAARGKELFFKTAGTQCINCHRIAGTGSTLGPDLSDIGKKYSRAQILESILEPSKNIDPKYVTYLAETKDGQVHTGLLAKKGDDEVVLKNVGDKEIRIPANKLATLVPQRTSLMPELLLRDLTAEQVADLLAFLAGLK